MAVHLRLLDQSDSETLFRWINTPELVVLSAPFKPVSRKHHDAWFEAVTRPRDDMRIYAIAVASGAPTIGYCQLKNIDPVSKGAELQIRIGETQMHGLGLGTQAVSRLLVIAFDEIKLHRVQLHVLWSNERARRAYLRCGFSEEGRLREAVCINGRYEDIVVMGLLARERRA